MRSNTFLGAACAVRAGVGVGLMSCCVADGLGGMVRISPVLDEIATELWLLVHPELRGTARVIEVYSFLRRALAARRKSYSGSG
jgi:DNA-binding transcriptional LysR family regulator